MTVIDTPEGIAWFAFLQVLHGLKLEVKTGMKVGRGSLIKVAQQRYGVTSRTKKGALAEMAAMFEEATGRKFEV